ncbi:hypothetical protein OEZ85_001555 [Tetradesmus obliquus]|uniref:Protein kinase domain-containing protein n=1 Tax=Tetradesmus obliquus TaxID=3088 RepID=A0ABY8U4C8_TETOB|nr:hypothetical protein OEZ85_001555 [Tetradesmus obliquus]
MLNHDSHNKHRIKVLHRIGRGSFGDVYRSVFDGQICAVKTIHDAQDELAFKMFKREAHILHECSHKRIVGFKALCRLTPKQAERQGKWALVLEYAKGGTLMHKVSQSMISSGRQVYSNAQALTWALHVASALQYLHGRSPAVLHRDVKLSQGGGSLGGQAQRLWASRGGGRLASDEAEEGWTEVESVFDMTGQTGSYMYMAPEVLLGQPYNEKADVFSFGVMLYELAARCLLLFSELPAHPSDPAVTERYAEKVSQGYRPSRPKRMPPGVWELVTACWQQQPAARPAMAGMVRALTQLLAVEERGAGSSGGSRRGSLSLGFNATAAFAASVTTVGSSKPAGKPGLAASASCSRTAAAPSEQVERNPPVEGPPACGCTVC